MSFAPQGGGGKGGIATELLATGSIDADGTDRYILNRTAGEIEAIFGWIDINNIQDGDGITITTKIDDRIHAQEIYEDSAANGILYLVKRTINASSTYKIILKQTKGTNRTYPYKLFIER